MPSGELDEDLARKSIGVGNVDEPILVSFLALIHLGYDLETDGAL